MVSSSNLAIAAGMVCLALSAIFLGPPTRGDLFPAPFVHDRRDETSPPFNNSATGGASRRVAARSAHRILRSCNLTAMLLQAWDGRGSGMWTVGGRPGRGAIDINATGAHCDPSGFTSDDVVNALEGHHVVFVGDSLNRFQYLSLVYFLESGSWASPYPSNTVVWQWEEAYGLLDERKKVWPMFMRSTNERMNAGAGQEICDCYRSGGDAFTIRENRYWMSGDGRLRVSYVQWFGGVAGWMPLKGHKLSLMNETCLAGAHNAVRARLQASSAADDDHHAALPRCKQGFCAPGECGPGAGSAADEGWDGDVWATLPKVLAQLDPTVAIINQGGWTFPRPKNELDVANSVTLMSLLKARATARSPPARVIWRSTTTANWDLRSTNLNRRMIPPLRAAGIEILDAYALTDALAHENRTLTEAAFTDDCHFYEPVYQLINMATIAQILLGHEPRPPPGLASRSF